MKSETFLLVAGIIWTGSKMDEQPFLFETWTQPVTYGWATVQFGLKLDTCS